MNNIETLHTLYIVSLTAAILMLVITIVLFFVFDMRHVIGKMLGFAEKKAIKEMEASTAFTSQLNDKYNKKMKDKVFTDTGSLKKKETPVQKLGMAPASPGGGNVPAGYGSSQTTVLGYNQSEAATTQLDYSEQDTTQLRYDASDSQTTVLAPGGETPQNPIQDLQFTITRQIMYIHTDEKI